MQELFPKNHQDDKEIGFNSEEEDIENVEFSLNNAIMDTGFVDSLLTKLHKYEHNCPISSLFIGKSVDEANRKQYVNELLAKASNFGLCLEATFHAVKLFDIIKSSVLFEEHGNDFLIFLCLIESSKTHCLSKAPQLCHSFSHDSKIDTSMLVLIEMKLLQHLEYDIYMSTPLLFFQALITPFLSLISNDFIFICEFILLIALQHIDCLYIDSEQLSINTICFVNSILGTQLSLTKDTSYDEWVEIIRPKIIEIDDNSRNLVWFSKFSDTIQKFINKIK